MSIVLFAFSGPRADDVIIGDMILSQEQYEIMYGKGPRSGVPYPSMQWPDGELPYEISFSVYQSDKQKIRNAVSKFNSEMKGCFKIV